MPGSVLLPSPLPVPTLDDPRTLRALAHPVRLALIDLLIIHGPLTASSAGRLLGLEPNAVSFHLRQLARYGFVGEAAGGKGRRRPWRLLRPAFGWTDGAAEPEVSRASESLSQINFARRQQQLREWMARRLDEAPRWRKAASASFSTLFLTERELADLGERLGRLSLEYMDRLDPARRPPGSRSVVVQTYSFPLQAEAGGAEASTSDAAEAGPSAESETQG